MLIVDTALKAREEEKCPVRVGMIGAGAMARGIAMQIIQSTPGMRLSAIANRTVASAQRAYEESGQQDSTVVDSLADLETAISKQHPAIVQDPLLLAQSESIDVIVEATGTIEFALQSVFAAIRHGKHVVLMNAELDSTVGPILKVYADRAGVILTACDGDQPGVEMNLYRFVKSIGLTPLVCGSMKGMLDHYRTPSTQAKFAKQWDQGVHMVTSFADGTKVSFEQAIVANGTGMTIAQRGMLGYEHRDHIDNMTDMYDVDQLKELGGIVEYAIGATPGPGVYVFATQENPIHQRYLDLYKLGKGPLYSFYTPYHLCYFEVPMSIARVALFNDVILAPDGAPKVDVITTAKKDLAAGETLDGIGGYTCYGQCEKADITYQQQLLPMGLSEGCTLKRPVSKDTVITYDDIVLPKDRLCDQLRAEQNTYFASAFK
ncbi:homoserine dehydrogenase [Leptolyngbya sp. Heron Island J]|uniref:NAD(P)H-dependent oxidoreductase n=1 Tax=Leptolyngbya sp. Heron Island J TaxID=1385935 RepID=UPI0003B9648E|nr:homoserine dehydrogenase [Leptolyngbya sp. Heron Island J]ESA32564.1 homoserine dehydrogenase [Leptolyngbya sp. Heron Island J]